LSYKINHEQTGFYRVKYLEKDILPELGRKVARKELASEDRWGLQNDLYALVKCCEISIDEYMDFLSFYTEEDSFLPLTSIADNLFHGYLVMDGKRREKIASKGRALFEDVLENIGYEPKEDENHSTALLRDQIIWHAILYGSKDVLEFAEAGFESIMKGNKIHPDIMKSVMQAGALNGDHRAFDWFEKRIETSESEHERMNILMAMGSFKDKKLIERAQQFILDKTPDRNKFIPIGQMAANPHAMPFMWGWYVTHLDQLEKLHPVHYERVIAAIVPLCGLDKKDLLKEFFDDYMKKKKGSKDVIKLSLEKLEINSAMREFFK